MSSGAPPAAVAVVRISGPAADAALEALAGALPPPRRARLATLREADEVLDNALVIRFPGPASATGEDVAELHLHGGRAVVAAVLAALGRIDGLRAAEAGEFTRRAFGNRRIDFTEAEGLADLLEAETEAQRRAALSLAGGALGRQVEIWRGRLLGLAAEVEAALDFSDEDDVAPLAGDFGARLDALRGEIAAWLARPPAERLKEGVRVVIAGPPNVGKSSLLNALVEREAAIVTEIAGTTRDVIEVPIAFEGVPFLLVDTAGLRQSSDAVEAIGVDRARASVATADIVLWLGPHDERPPDAILVHAKADLGAPQLHSGLAVSAVTGAGLGDLTAALAARAKSLLPQERQVALNRRHRKALGAVDIELGGMSHSDLLIQAECLRRAREALDQVTGKAGVEEMLDALFGRFCIGK